MLTDLVVAEDNQNWTSTHTQNI